MAHHTELCSDPDALLKTKPAMPSAMPARASCAACARRPSAESERPPGRCNACVASKITGAIAFHVIHAEHIDHQVVIAETRSALTKENVLITRLGEFIHDVTHFMWC